MNVDEHSGIKKALAFLIKKEMDIELSKVANTNDLFPTYEIRQQEMKKRTDRVLKRYKKLLDGLGEKI
jgi:hypothetical protein